MARRRLVGSAGLVWLVALVMACAPARQPPDASGATGVASGGTAVTFEGRRYEAFAAETTSASPPERWTLVVPLADIAPIGAATDADPSQFPDRTVFRIMGVDPRDAVVMFDRTARQPEMLVFTRGGASPTVVAGLCDYYADPDPSLHQCRETGSPSP